MEASTTVSWPKEQQIRLAPNELFTAVHMEGSTAVSWPEQQQIPTPQINKWMTQFNILIEILN